MAELCLPAGIDRHSIHQLEQLVKTGLALSKGDYLFRGGGELQELFVVSAGAIKSVAVSDVGDETVTGFHLPGELIGLDALASGKFRTDGIALCDSRICRLPVARLDEACGLIPGLQRQLLRLMGRCVARGQEHCETLVRVQASERLARFLIDLSERFQQGGHSPSVLHLPMTRQEIAKFLGVAFETVSRCFGKLVDDKLLEASGRRIHLLDLERLRLLAGGDQAAPAKTTAMRTGETRQGAGTRF